MNYSFPVNRPAVSTGYIPLDFRAFDAGSLGGAAPVSALPETSGGWLDGFMNRPDGKGGVLPGWGGMALGTAQGLFNGYMAMKQYGLAKQQLAEGKRQFGLNYEAQRSTINSQLEDRQRARVASNPGAYQSVGDYMSTYGIKKAG